MAVDPTGGGTVYRFITPAGNNDTADTDFFTANGVTRTFGLVNQPGDPDAEWGFNAVSRPGGAAGSTIAQGTFTVNPVNGQQVLIGSLLGNVYRTENSGSTWFLVANPASLDGSGSYPQAVAFGAPDPTAPAGIGNLDNFLYAGLDNGNIFVSTTGGGSGGGNAWTNISAGLGGDGAVLRIITDPLRGSHDAFAVTLNGVYYIPNSVVSPSNPNPTWQNITGNLFSLMTPGAYGNTSEATQQLNYLTSLQVDWRYLIPNVPGNASAGTHPVLYVSGDGGVFRSLDNGLTWTDFPNTDPQLDNGPVEGGYLPHTTVTSMQLSDGNINPQTGRATISTANGVTDPSLLSLSTYGRGQFAIRLAPIIVPNAAVDQPTSDNFLATRSRRQYSGRHDGHGPAIHHERGDPVVRWPERAVGLRQRGFDRGVRYEAVFAQHRQADPRGR